ncbi:MAG: hypothetical protein IKR19_07925 [Acholeplasmatales bacterium]|nr:hypothetical protein [Acholeplasmatales bacterium]
MGEIISFIDAKETKENDIINEELNDTDFCENLNVQMDSIYLRAKDINNNVLNTNLKIF